MIATLSSLLVQPWPSAEALPAGQVFAIRAVPDLFTGETINVGVCVITPDGRRYVKVIEKPGRLECLYGEASQEILQLASAAEFCAKSGIPFPGENIVFDEPTTFYNLSPTVALESYFRDFVTVAAQKPAGVAPAPQVTTEAARVAVTNLVRARRSSIALDKLIAESPNILINVQDKPRLVYVPLQPPRGAGTIESADYGAETIRFHLLDRLTDLAAVQAAGKADHLAMFIVRPDRSVSEKQMQAVDNAIDKVLWKVPRNMRVEIESVDRTADLVAEWGEDLIRRGTSSGDLDSAP